ncbi:MAG: hypothetical protein FWG70_08225 [Oscillospiraceae bacterium]|nr:hypothetical protein [Oscillospiraceae bacterium]
MKNILLVSALVLLLLLSACGKRTAIDGEIDSEVHPLDTSLESDITMPPPATTTTPPVTVLPEQETDSAFISAEEALDLVKQINNEDNAVYDIFAFYPYPVNEKDYYSISATDKETGNIINYFYVNKLTGEVYTLYGRRLILLPLTEKEELAVFVESFTLGQNYVFLMPPFDNINEISAKDIVHFYYYFGFYSDSNTIFDFEYTQEQLENKNLYPDIPEYWSYLSIIGAKGVKPYRIEEYIQKQYNTDFNIQDYDFSDVNYWLDAFCNVRWEEETGAIVYIYNDTVTGGNGVSCHTLKTEFDESLYYTITVDIITAEYTSYVEGYYLNTVRKNEDGRFNIISKQPVNINDISFTEEEFDKIKEMPWYGDIIMIDDKFVITLNEARKAIEDIPQENEMLTFGTIIGSLEENLKYYNFSIYEYREDERHYLAFYCIDKITGEAYLYDQETGELIPIN